MIDYASVVSENNGKKIISKSEYDFMPKISEADREAISDSALPQNIDHIAELKLAKRGLIIAFALGALGLAVGSFVEKNSPSQVAKSDKANTAQAPQMR